MKIPNFRTKKELFRFLVENKETIKAAKKAAIKYADGCPYLQVYDNGEVQNKAAIDTTDLDSIQVKAAINTTNILDSHGDVHIKGLWSKSLRENTMIKHIQEHKMEFDKIISDGKNLKVSAKDMTFSELGYKYDGETQVLHFDSTVKLDRNPFMFKQYADGNVTNHSVGMRYVKLFLAVNDENYKTEKAVWDKYYPVIANKSIADEQGYFWAVTEAKVVEGSAVPIGSNRVTPTISVNTKEAGETHFNQEPPKGTQIQNYLINYLNN